MYNQPLTGNNKLIISLNVFNYEFYFLYLPLNDFIMNLVRKIKISKITNIPLSGNEKEIVDFIKLQLSNLTTFKIITQPFSTYYMNSNGNVMIYYDSENDRMGIRWLNFWEKLETYYNLEYKHVYDIIKFIIEETFKIRVTKIGLEFNFSITQLEKIFRENKFNHTFRY